MLRTCKINRRINSLTPNNGNEKKKIKNRNPYVAYLKNLNAILISCSILLCMWLFGRWHILLNPYNENITEINILFLGMIILFNIILFYLENYLHHCGDNRKLTYIL